MLASYYDLYKSIGVCPQRFTPSKVEFVLRQPMPKLLVDAMRELIRPQGWPTGLLFIPHPMSFANATPYDPTALIRNMVPLDHPDVSLLDFQVQWFVSLSHTMRAAWMTGTSIGPLGIKLVENMKGEELELVKASMLVHVREAKVVPQAQHEEDGDGDDEKKNPTSEGKVELVDNNIDNGFKIMRFKPGVPHFPAVNSKAPALELKGASRWTGFTGYVRAEDLPLTWADSIVPNDDESKGEIKRTYFIHDFTESDATRDFAVRLLQPIIVNIVDDIFVGSLQVVNDIAPQDLAFMGTCYPRSHMVYTIWNFQSDLELYNRGNPLIEDNSFYVNRWISQLGAELSAWSFPHLESAGPKEKPKQQVYAAKEVKEQQPKPQQQQQNNKGKGKKPWFNKKDKNAKKKASDAEGNSSNSKSDN